MLSLNIVDTYSKVHVPITHTNNTDISFEGPQKQQEFLASWEKIEKYYLQNPTPNISFLEILTNELEMGIGIKYIKK